jgi:hypothetical protein
MESPLPGDKPKPGPPALRAGSRALKPYGLEAGPGFFTRALLNDCIVLFVKVLNSTSLIVIPVQAGNPVKWQNPILPLAERIMPKFLS